MNGVRPFHLKQRPLNRQPSSPRYSPRPISPERRSTSAIPQFVSVCHETTNGCHYRTYDAGRSGAETAPKAKRISLWRACCAPRLGLVPIMPDRRCHLLRGSSRRIWPIPFQSQIHGVKVLTRSHVPVLLGEHLGRILPLQNGPAAA